ncbi:antitoxin Xre/MbcA/ParS toxin-binding domain-containing protein [Dyella sp. C11]|uniref:antitoxin Xre/MbcA/ParS toxin-binding domain-containing protein n=1 Tax=Dyella sp. C11 TaxID=2126991 RepID=UPI000D6462B3|nr:antitoxin Xre/MbcA/ParS toxin-binding domain-containing protein [Dyella sp. C11]
MRNSQCRFEDIANEMAQVDAMREQARMNAFNQLESQAATIASMLLQLFGNRERAARWMCMRQRPLGGRTAYEALAEGDFDRVWDLMIGSGAEG